MTDLPSREELEQAISNYDNAVSDERSMAWDEVTVLLDAILGNLHASSVEAITLEEAKAISNVGVDMTVNDSRRVILGWSPLPPDDHRGNRLLRVESNV